MAVVWKEEVPDVGMVCIVDSLYSGISDREEQTNRQECISKLEQLCWEQAAGIQKQGGMG